jgi:hypothetical protein
MQGVPDMPGGNAPKACGNSRCLGNYDFDAIARHARKRFVDGLDTMALLEQATSQREKEEISLVCLLDVEDKTIKYLRLECVHADRCKATDCRERLVKLIEQDLLARDAPAKSVPA